MQMIDKISLNWSTAVQLVIEIDWVRCREWHGEIDCPPFLQKFSCLHPITISIVQATLSSYHVGEKVPHGSARNLLLSHGR